jgi:hypothetical protein
MQATRQNNPRKQTPVAEKIQRYKKNQKKAHKNDLKKPD